MEISSRNEGARDECVVTIKDDVYRISRSIRQRTPQASLIFCLFFTGAEGRRPQVFDERLVAEVACPRTALASRLVVRPVDGATVRADEHLESRSSVDHVTLVAGRQLQR